MAAEEPLVNPTDKADNTRPELLTSEQWQAIKRVARQLRERGQQPMAQLVRLAHYCGLAFVEQLVEETLQIEANGGMMTTNGSRRRTRGGTFFYLAKSRVPYELRPKIFPYPYQRKNGGKSKQPSQSPSTPPPPPAPPFDWEQRTTLVPELFREAGEATNVKVALIGRPDKVTASGDVVTLRMKHAGKFPSTPKGVPTPELPPTPYTVYVASKQWKKIEASLNDAEDFLIIEGMCAFNPQLGGVAVYATNVTSRNLQVQKRQK